jgi:DNA transposition AAA+ family ATPase
MGEVNTTIGTIAPLRNVSLFSELTDRVQRRQHGLPGMACFYGPSGLGKTHSAIYAANRHRAFHVQVRSVWTRRTFCSETCLEMGIVPARTIPDMVKQIGSELAMSRRPLIIDESDFLVAKGMIEIVRDLYEGSYGAIILIGEEQLPHKLKAWERVHGRMLDWVQAQPASLADARHLARLYCKGIEVDDDLLTELFEKSGGSARRICVNLDRVREAALTAGLPRIGRAGYDRPFFTGAPPARRS